MRTSDRTTASTATRDAARIASANVHETAVAVLDLTDEETDAAIAAGERHGIGWEEWTTRLVRHHLATGDDPLAPRYDLDRLRADLVAELRADPDRTDEGEPLWSEAELQSLRLAEWQGNVYTIGGREPREICRLTLRPDGRFRFEEVGCVDEGVGLDAYRAPVDLPREAGDALASLLALPEHRIAASADRLEHHRAGRDALKEARRHFRAAAAGDGDALLTAGRIGDAMLHGLAAHAADETAALLAGAARKPDLREELREFGAAIASGEQDGEAGQRRLIAGAAAVEAAGSEELAGDDGAEAGEVKP